MANNTYLEISDRTRTVLLLDQVTTAQSSEYEFVGDFVSKTITLDQIEEGGVGTLHISNSVKRPLANSDGPVIFTFDESTTNTFVSLNDYRWVKVKRSIGASPVPTSVVLRMHNKKD